MAVHIAAKVAYHGVKFSYQGLVKGLHQLKHLIAEHAHQAALAGALGAGAIATAAYLDYAFLKLWWASTPPTAAQDVEHALKVAVLGNMVNMQFTTKATSKPADVVLQGYQDATTGKLVNHRFVKFEAMDPDLAAKFSAEKVLVLS